MWFSFRPPFIKPSGRLLSNQKNIQLNHVQLYDVISNIPNIKNICLPMFTSESRLQK